jgi:hypothetical protein
MSWQPDCDLGFRDNSRERERLLRRSSALRLARWQRLPAQEE